VPVLDLLEIGAGGGSTAHINPLGLLQVGPESAGADPGPACYGRGGAEPTVTDADLVLGYLNPDYFLGGTMRLDVEASRAVIRERLADKLAIDPLLAAWGIHDLVNENMAAAAKMHLAEKGGDPSTLALVAFGGAGPVHCYSLAKKLGVRRIIVPVAAGVASALGFLTAPVSYDVVRTHKIALADADSAHLEAIYRTMEEEALAILRKGGEAGEATFNRSADIRYIGQGYEINVALPPRRAGVPDRQGLLAIFTEGYRRFYGRTFPENEFEIVNLRVVVEGPEPGMLLRRRDKRRSGGSTKGTRPAYLGPEQKFVDHTVYDRYRLVPGDVVHGPAIVEERESTTCIGPDASITVDDYGMLDIRIEASK
jgi:N-methylhydantoinase A